MKLKNLEALQAQRALSKLIEVDLPVKVSLDIALISNMVDVQARAFGLVRDKLLKTYSIKTQPGEIVGSIKFESTVKGETEEETSKLQTENLEAFVEKFNDLMEAKTEDLQFKKIQLPKEVGGKPLQIKPEILKALVEFVEVE